MRSSLPSIVLSGVLSGVLASALVATADAAPARYKIDSDHTYPSFEADHFGGMSVWRGKFKQTAGHVVIDRQAKTGDLEVTIDLASVASGHDKLDAHLKSPDFFDVAKYPTATYRGRFSKFEGDVPTEVQGELTLKGVTKPVTLTLRSFKCMNHPMRKVEFCGADAVGTLDREAFGISFGKNMGFDMQTRLAIQVEAFLEK